MEREREAQYMEERDERVTCLCPGTMSIRIPFTCSLCTCMWKWISTVKTAQVNSGLRCSLSFGEWQVDAALGILPGPTSWLCSPLSPGPPNPSPVSLSLFSGRQAGFLAFAGSRSRLTCLPLAYSPPPPGKKEKREREGEQRVRPPPQGERLKQQRSLLAVSGHLKLSQLILTAVAGITHQPASISYTFVCVFVCVCLCCLSFFLSISSIGFISSDEQFTNESNELISIYTTSQLASLLFNLLCSSVCPITICPLLDCPRK